MGAWHFTELRKGNSCTKEEEMGCWTEKGENTTETPLITTYTSICLTFWGRLLYNTF